MSGKALSCKWQATSLLPFANSSHGFLQVLELTQGQQVEKEILAVLVRQMQEGRQKEGMDGYDTPSERPPLCLRCLLLRRCRFSPTLLLLMAVGSCVKHHFS